MQRGGVMPNKFTFLHALSACASHANAAEGKVIHSCIVQRGLEKDVVVATAIITMYGKWRIWEDAESVFANIPDRDIVSWNAMIAAYAQHGHIRESLHLFIQMEVEGLVPDNFTFLSILNASATKAILAEGKSLHVRVLNSSFALHIVLANSLINVYNKCGSIEDAQKMFDQMHDRNVVSWTSVIGTYVQHGQYKGALQLFQQMQLEGVVPNKVTFISVLSACTSVLALDEGKRIQTLGGSQMESNIVVGNALVNMHGKCGRFDLAEMVFERMHDRDVVSWNAMIAVYAQHCLGRKTLQLFQQMQLEGLFPNKVTFLSILSACSNQTSHATAKQIHALIVSSNLEADIIVGTSLMNMYGKCGNVENAQAMYEKMPKHDVIAWNAVMKALTQNGHAKEALHLFQRCQLEGLMPDKVTFVSILDACGNHLLIIEGKQMHIFILGFGFDSDVIVGNALINMYAKCGRLEEAQILFQTMPKRDVVSWNAMIVASAHCGQDRNALQLFHDMQPEGIIPDNVTFASLLSAYACEAVLKEGKRMHARIVGSGLNSDVVVENAVVNMYGKCGSMEEAQFAFDKISE